MKEDFCDIRGRHYIPSSDVRKDIVLAGNYRAGIPPLGLRSERPDKAYTVNGVELSDDYSDSFYLILSRSNRFNNVSAALAWKNHYFDADGRERSYREPFYDVDYCYAKSEIGHCDIDDFTNAVDKLLDKLQWLTESDYSTVKNTLMEMKKEFIKKYY